MRLERRSVFGWGPSGAGSASPRNGIAVHYDGNDQSLANKQHASCRTYWKNTRRFHMGPSRGWADIGYSFAVCPHGYVLEGRGLDRQQAAQPGGNSTWYSVTFMSGPSEHPTAAQLTAFRQLRSWLRGKGVRAAIKPHSAFVSTSCCGNILRHLISNGTLAAGTPRPTPTPPRPGTSAPAFPLPAGHWFGAESADRRNHSGYWAADRPHIRKLQQRLKDRGWRIPVSGRYDAATATVVRSFQAEKNLRSTGRTDSATWRAAWTARIT